MKLIPSLRKSMLLFAVINLSNLTSQSTRKLWAAVNSKYRGHDSRIPKYISADCLNDFFAKISTGQHPNSEVYHSSAVKCDVEISEHQIEKILRCVKRTSTGWDGLPSWLFKKCSVELAPVVTHLKNYSINEGQIPDIWRTAIVTLFLNLHSQLRAMTTDPYQLPLSCHALQRELLLTDGYVLQFVRNFFSVSMLIGQLAVLQQHLYTYFIVLLGYLKTQPMLGQS